MAGGGRMRASSSASKPVVPMTWTMRAWAARSASIIETIGRVKSIDGLGLGDQRQGIGGELDAIGLQARQRAGIHAQIGMAFRFQRAAQE